MAPREQQQVMRYLGPPRQGWSWRCWCPASLPGQSAGRPWQLAPMHLQELALPLLQIVDSVERSFELFFHFIFRFRLGRNDGGDMAAIYCWLHFLMLMPAKYLTNFLVMTNLFLTLMMNLFLTMMTEGTDLIRSLWKRRLIQHAVTNAEYKHNPCKGEATSPCPLVLKTLGTFKI